MKPYWSPYAAGVGLGLTLLITYILMGFGLGASGAFTHVAAHLEGAVLSPGAWAFTLAFMGSGFVTAWIVRRAWR